TRTNHWYAVAGGIVWIVQHDLYGDGGCQRSLHERSDAYHWNDVQWLARRGRLRRSFGSARSVQRDYVGGHDILPVDTYLQRTGSQHVPGRARMAWRKRIWIRHRRFGCSRLLPV